MLYFFTAFGLGLLGSLHCAGMCGPIALALPFHRQQGWKQLAGNITYQAGRITSYVFLGLLLGTIGRGFSLGGLQQPLSIAIGITMILTIVLPRLVPIHRTPAIWQRAMIALKKQLGTFLQKQTTLAFYITGLLNGLLPCGLVYMALLAALGIGSPLQSALFMAAFGLGTFPMMFFIALTSQIISVRWRNLFNRLAPVAVVVLGLVFVLRGLGLGIPYLSPPSQALQVQQTGQCH